MLQCRVGIALVACLLILTPWILFPGACASSPVVEDGEKEIQPPPLPKGQRNVIAVGLQRFAEGTLQPQPDWEQLTDRVVCVLAQNPGSFTLNGTNCYLVGTGRKRLLIDTGEQHFGADAFMNILSSCMEELGVEGLDGIVITHMHHDHYGNVGRLQDKYGPVPVYSRELSHRTSPLLSELRRRGQIQHFLTLDGKPLYNPKVDGKPPKLPEDVDISWAHDRVKHFHGKNTEEKLHWIFFMTWHHQDLIDRLRNCEYPWTAVDSGDTISTEGATLTAMHMPGHSDDHMTFLLEEEHSLFSGDHVLGWGTTFIMEMKDYMDSLRKMLHMHPVSLFPGHGHFIEDGVDILQRYISHRQMREQQTWEALVKRKEPVRIDVIVHELYPNTVPERLWMARSNVEVLLRKFVAEGAASVFVPSWDGRLRRMRKLPTGYDVRHLPDGYLWAARRTVPTPNL